MAGAGGTAGLVSSLRKEILAAYRERIRLSGVIAPDSSGAVDLALADARDMLAELVRALGADHAQPDRPDDAAGGEFAPPAAPRAHPYEVTESTSVLFDTVLSVVTPHLPADPTASAACHRLATALQRTIATRVRASLAQHTGLLLNSVPRAQVEERRQIAKDLHDRMGHCLSTVQKQLELYDLHQVGDPPVAEGHWQGAWESLQESMRYLRAVTSRLHMQQPPRSLEAALRAYLEVAETGGAQVTVQVNGDETWASPKVLDECFLVLREAARNALSHARPRLLRIDVDITPYELRGTVVDNGCGFDPSTPVGGGLGLISMVTRAELLGGRLTFTSLVGEGTRIGFSVPLSGRPVEHIA